MIFFNSQYLLAFNPRSGTFDYSRGTTPEWFDTCCGWFLLIGLSLILLGTTVASFQERDKRTAQEKKRDKEKVVAHRLGGDSGKALERMWKDSKLRVASKKEDKDKSEEKMPPSGFDQFGKW